MKKECNNKEFVFDTDDLKIERKNKMYLSNNEIKTLEKYNVNYNNYDSLSSLIFDLNEIEGDDDLEQLAIELSEFNYYNNQNNDSSPANFLTIKEVSKRTGFSVKQTRKLFNDPDFPSCDYAKSFIVEESALKAYFAKKHIKTDSPYWRA